MCAHDPPADRHDVEHLVAVCAERAQRAAACGQVQAPVAARGRSPRAADGPASARTGAGRSGRSGIIRLTRLGAGGFGLQLFERQFELRNLAGQLLRRGAEAHPRSRAIWTRSLSISTIAGIDLSLEASDPGVPDRVRKQACFDTPLNTGSQTLDTSKNGVIPSFLPRQAGPPCALGTPPVDALQQHRQLRGGR